MAEQEPESARTGGAVALIVAAGSGTRAGGDLPKQYRPYRGMPLLRHSVAAFAAWPGTTRIVVAIGAGQDDLAAAAIAPHRADLVTGGATRRDSVRLGLEAIAASGGADTVYIHDAARPGLDSATLDRLAAALARHPGAVPVLPVVDTIAARDTDRLGDPVDRAALLRVQTPQAFRFADILAAHRAWPDDREATDDAGIARAAGLAVAAVAGDEGLKKMTFATDFDEGSGAALPLVRTGMGYDVHRLVVGEPLWLGGIRIDHTHGLAGHSDADVALHALTDALLGAMALGDIGEHFPPSDARWRGAASATFLAHAAELVRTAGATIANVDLTLICEAPRIGPHKIAMQQRIAAILALETGRVAVKATTTERLGFAGRGEGIAAQAIATVIVPGTAA